MRLIEGRQNIYFSTCGAHPRTRKKELRTHGGITGDGDYYTPSLTKVGFHHERVSKQKAAVTR
jgi:hypothetical protein